MRSNRNSPLAATGVIATGQLVLVAITVWRLLATRESAVGADICLGCQGATLLQHDAGIWAILWVLLLLATLPWRALRLLAVTALLALLLLLLADVVVLQQFGLRLYLADLLTYGQQPRFIAGYVAKLSWWQWLPLAAIFVLAAWGVYRAAGRSLARSRARMGVALMAGICALLYALPDQAAHPLPWTYQNLLEANRPSGADQPFSAAYRRSLLERPPASFEQVRCEEGLDWSGNIIIVALESWSWYHSGLLLPDSLDATPGLDGLARQGAWWDRFLANGFTTDHGLIAMLAGQLPVPAINRYRSLDAYSGYEGDWRALPERLRQDGYHTAFLTSGHLGFLDKGEWLDTLGFEHLEGHDHAAYEDAPRYQFAAASDDLLYARVIDWMREDRPPGKPFLAFVETVTTHPPFTDPLTGHADEKAAFEFADAALDRFVDALEELDFFDRGLLIVTSDQRALTPLREIETSQFGDQAGGRLPLVMVGDKLPLSGRQTVTGQMLDLPFSLDYLLTEEACRLPGQGNLFTGEAPDCVFMPNGNRRSIIHAFCGDHAAEILMDGDNTRVVEGVLPDADRRIRRLNYQRALLGEREVNAHNVL